MRDLFSFNVGTVPTQCSKTQKLRAKSLVRNILAVSACASIFCEPSVRSTPCKYLKTRILREQCKKNRRSYPSSPVARIALEPGAEPAPRAALTAARASFRGVN